MDNPTAFAQSAFHIYYYHNQIVQTTAEYTKAAGVKMTPVVLFIFGTYVIYICDEADTHLPLAVAKLLCPLNRGLVSLFTAHAVEPLPAVSRGQSVVEQFF